MSKQKVLYTQDGFQALKDELDYLKNTRRGEIVKEIEIARGFGDLSENSEYDEARTEQAKTEARIKELEEKIENAEISNGTDDNSISVGFTVTVYDRNEDEKEVYVIVGSNEVDGDQKISDLSPIGKVLMGHHEGDKVIVEAPKCKYELEILKVERTKKA